MYSGKSLMDINIIKDRHNTGKSIYLSTEHNSVDVAAEAFLKQLLEQTNQEHGHFSINDLNTPEFNNTFLKAWFDCGDRTILYYNNGVEVAVLTADFDDHTNEIRSKDLLYVLRTYGIEFDASKYSPHR